ncbi:hypothetical protein GCM10010345_92170 [Streptomyces canarius]|uniref:Uncharacterized protein n=1 Tax=Streptomyces canarius TaxID=285453 RepID=A0ABQ3DDP4_9ACTN|nr:hypothetical protein GCM10010345_92170 [Streptomyces canarius]
MDRDTAPPLALTGRSDGGPPRLSGISGRMSSPRPTGIPYRSSPRPAALTGGNRDDGPADPLPGAVLLEHRTRSRQAVLGVRGREADGQGAVRARPVQGPP